MKYFVIFLLLMSSFSVAGQGKPDGRPADYPPSIASIARKQALEHLLQGNKRVVGVGIAFANSNHEALYVYANCPVRGIPRKFQGVPVIIQCTETPTAQGIKD
jgi:hypothetical protein